MSTSERASSSSEQPVSQAASQAGNSGGARAPTPYTGRWAREDGRCTPTRQSAHLPASAVGRTQPSRQTLRCPCPPVSPLQSGINLHLKVHFGFQSHGVSRCLRYCRVASVSPPSNTSSTLQPAKVDMRLTSSLTPAVASAAFAGPSQRAFTGLLACDKYRHGLHLGSLPRL